MTFILWPNSFVHERVLRRAVTRTNKDDCESLTSPKVDKIQNKLFEVERTGPGIGTQRSQRSSAVREDPPVTGAPGPALNAVGGQSGAKAGNCLPSQLRPGGGTGSGGRPSFDGEVCGVGSADGCKS